MAVKDIFQPQLGAVQDHHGIYSLFYCEGLTTSQCDWEWRLSRHDKYIRAEVQDTKLTAVHRQMPELYTKAKKEVKATVCNDLSDLLTQINVFVHK